MKSKTKRRDDDELEGVKKIADIKRHRSYAIYGRSGSGKTTLAADFPKPMLYLDIRDEGTDSIADVEGIDVKEIEDFDDVEEVMLWLRRNPKKYKTVVLDTMTQLQELVVQEVAESRKRKLKGKQAGEFGTLQKQDWAEVSSKLKSIIIDYRDLPMEVVFIAQERVFNLDDEESDSADQLAPEVGPALMPSVKQVLNAAVTVVACAFVRRKTVTKEIKGKKVKREKSVYALRLGPNPVYTTKVRKPRDIEAPDFIEDPSYQAIVDVIKGEA